VLLETDRAKAHQAAREALSRYFQLDNYINSWRRQDFGDKDLAGGGSDRFLDAVVASGNESAIRARIQEYWDAGADHVCIQPISPQGSRQPVDDRILELLAPARRARRVSAHRRHCRWIYAPARASAGPVRKARAMAMYSETTRSINV